MELTLRQYADSLGLSYEAARASFKVHEGKDLKEGEHFRRQGRTKVLTDAGIAAMNEYRKKPVAITPGDVSALNARLKELQTQIDTLTGEKAALEAEAAALRLQIVGLEAKLNERNDALIDALFRLQNANERLLTAADTPKEEQKKGFFARLFNRK